jgi:hypothetical protein
METQNKKALLNIFVWLIVLPGFSILSWYGLIKFVLFLFS